MYGCLRVTEANGAGFVWFLPFCASYFSCIFHLGVYGIFLLKIYKSVIGGKILGIVTRRNAYAGCFLFSGLCHEASLPIFILLGNK